MKLAWLVAMAFGLVASAVTKNCTVPHSPTSVRATAFHVFLPAVLIFLSLYRLFAPFYSTTKQRSWILTGLSSAFMTMTSVPFVLEYLGSGFDVNCVGYRSRSGSDLAYISSRVFQAYLVADQIAGATYYKDQVNLLTGWIHHNLYIIIVECAIRLSSVDVFALCTIMELPTFILSLSFLHPSSRTTIRHLFAGTFFVTRIVFHLVLCRAYLAHHSRAHVGLLPGLMIAAIWPLHAYWFYGCLRGLVAGAESPRRVAPSIQVRRRGRTASLEQVLKLEIEMDIPNDAMLG